MKKVLCIILAAVLLCGAAACGKKYAPSGRTLFTFDGEAVKEEEFIFSYRNIITYFEGYFETSFAEFKNVDLGQGKTVADLCGEYAVQEVGYAAVVRRIIAQNGIPWTADDAKRYDDLMAQYTALEGSREELAKKLALNGMTVEMLENSVRQYVYLSKVGDFLFANGTLKLPTESELETEFANRVVRVKSVFFSLEGLSEADRRVKLALVEKAAAEYAGGKGIEELIALYSDDEEGRLTASEGYLLKKGTTDAALFEAAVNANEGVLTRAETSNGVHLFVRFSAQEFFEEYRDELLSSVKDERLSAYVDGLYDKAVFTVDEKLYDEIVATVLSEY